MIDIHVSDRLVGKRSVVALETAVLTHGLPYPRNVEAVLEMEEAVRSSGAYPATIGIIGGVIKVGLSREEIEFLGQVDDRVKVSMRDIPAAVWRRDNGGTTVSATMWIASKVGIQIFATGGIGGVHRGVVDTFDISLDMKALASLPVIVVSSGAKSILDLPKTLEYLETMGVPVGGYGTDVFPAFYTGKTDLKLSLIFDAPDAVASYWRTHRRLGYDSGLLVANPIPEDRAIPADEMERVLEQAEDEMTRLGIVGKDTTPFLLSYVAEKLGDRVVDANIALLVNNARVAGAIARFL
jgi:pseudouridine-5'-phosphate glycosidase